MCALAPDVHTLVIWRFVQGLGACAGMVIPRAVVRDLHTGEDAARLMALLTLVFKRLAHIGAAVWQLSDRVERLACRVLGRDRGRPALPSCCWPPAWKKPVRPKSVWTAA